MENFRIFYYRYPKIKIEVGQFTENNNHYCIIQIANQSKEKKFFERPSFIADKVFKENGTMFGHVGDLTFPFLIDSGPKIEFKFPYSVLIRYKNDYKIKKVQAIIKDTLDKKYKSKWTDI